MGEREFLGAPKIIAQRRFMGVAIAFVEWLFGKS